MYRTLYVAAGLLAAATAVPTTDSSISKRVTGPSRGVSNFTDIPPSADLQWTPCYEHFHCANLEVPLDYDNKSLGSTVVAWIRQDAANGSDTDLLYNPGGPGGSGIDYLLSGGGNGIMKLTGGRYNLVSWDPRGVNASAIDLTCFPDDPESAALYSTGGYETEQENYAAAVAYNRWCSVTIDRTEVRYAGTVAVVQDMMHFTELQAAQRGQRPEDALIWYYGVSYGTVIGQTLAALFPDRIGRVILDANVHGEEHYKGATDTAVENADDTVRWFFELCHEAGNKSCPFAGDAKSPQDLEKRFNDILASLEKEPLQSIAPRNGGPVIVTKDRVLGQVFNWLYAPASYFPYMGVALNALDNVNATAWLDIEYELTFPDTPGPFNYTSTAASEVLQLVTNIDAAGRYPYRNVEEYMRAVDEIEETDAWFGDSYSATNVLINAGSTIKPPESQLFPGFEKTQTKNPIFFLNNNADPITPLSSAEHMSTFFEGSVVLTQNAGGHSVTSVESECTTQYIQAYLSTGKLPAKGTVCEVSEKPLVDELKKRNVPLVRRHVPLARRRI